MKTAKIVEFFENNVWIEKDIFGDAHVMIKSAKAESEPVCVVTVRYARPYIDNSTRDEVAAMVAESFGATNPVEFRYREIQHYH